MDALAPRLDCTGTMPPFGYRQFHRDVGLNFECNRWAEWIGPEAIGEVAQLAARANTYPEWIDGFLGLAEQARAAGRPFAAGFYDRAAEFFMTTDDPRRAAARERFLHTMRATYDVAPEHIPFGTGALPAYDLRPQRQIGSTIVMFGGFDSYIEEFLPLMAAMVHSGRRVVAFEGPGQGSALEDYRLPLIAEWERPVAAVLDHYGLDDVTAVGISMGGALVIRAAAFEPRITRAVAYDVLDDMLGTVVGQLGPGQALMLRALLAIRARRIINAVAGQAISRRPVAEWGMRQGMRITGTTTPYDFLRSIAAISTRGVSQRVTADVLLLAGADDHFVPLTVLWRQATALTHARSLTTRIFTADEQASNHCQAGNYGAAARVIDDWLNQTTTLQRKPAIPVHSA
jgi:pimeloyl-ACP methyl ester carboxylesterase